MAHGGQKPKTSHKEMLMMSLSDPSFPHMFRAGNKSPAPYTDPRASVHSPGPLLVHRGDPRKELPTAPKATGHPPPLHPNKAGSGSSGSHPPGLTVTPSRPGSLMTGTPKAQPVHTGGPSQHSPRYEPSHHAPQGSITKGQPVYRAQEAGQPPRRAQAQHPPGPHSGDARAGSHPSLEAYKAGSRGSPYPTYQSSPRPSSHEQPGLPRSSRSIIESDYSIAQSLPKHPREPGGPPTSGFPRTIDPHGGSRREVQGGPPAVDPRIDPRVSDPRLIYSAAQAQAQRFGPPFGGRGDPRADVRGDPRAELPGVRGDPRAEIPGNRGDPRAERDRMYQDSRHVQDPRSVDPRSVPMLDPRASRAGAPQLYPSGYPDPRAIPRSRSPPRQPPHPSQTSAPSPSGGPLTQGRPKPPREAVERYPPHPEVSITKSLPGGSRPPSEYSNLDDLAQLAETRQRLPDGRNHVGPAREAGRPVSSGPPMMDPRALAYERQIQERSKAAADAAALGPPRANTSRDAQRILEQQQQQAQQQQQQAQAQQARQAQHSKHELMQTYNQLSEQDQKAYLETLKVTGGRTPQPDHMSAANLIDLIITHQINRNTVGPAVSVGPQVPNPRRSPQMSVADGKDSPSKVANHSPVVKNVADNLEVGGPSGSGGVRTSPGTMGEHIENMITKEVGRGASGSPYPGPSNAEAHEHWKRRGYPVQDGGPGSYRPPSQPRPPSNSHPGMSTDERVIHRVAQNASPSSGGRPDKPPSRSMHEAISPPSTGAGGGPSYPSMGPHTMYPGQQPIEPAMAKFLAARRKEEAERAAAVSRSAQGVTHFDDYVKYKITEVMKNEKSGGPQAQPGPQAPGSGAPGPSEPKAPSSMGPPHKRPLETEARGSPGSEHQAPESPNKRYKRDDGTACSSQPNDMPDSPESGDMVIDESARPDSAHSQKTNSPAPQGGPQSQGDPQHYREGYRGPPGAQAPPRSSPAPSGQAQRQAQPQAQGTGPGLARYEPLSDDD